MNKKAIIRIQGIDIFLYKNFNRYPEATFRWLNDFHKDFIKNRKNSPNYELAQLLRNSVINADKYDLDRSKYTGWSIFDGDENDLDYTYRYILYSNGKVGVTEDVMSSDGTFIRIMEKEYE